MGMCSLYEGCALPALVGSTLMGGWLPDAKHGADFKRPIRRMAALRRSRMGLVIPSIAHTTISLYSMVGWQR